MCRFYKNFQKKKIALFWRYVLCYSIFSRKRGGAEMPCVKIKGIIVVMLCMTMLFLCACHAPGQTPQPEPSPQWEIPKIPGLALNGYEPEKFTQDNGFLRYDGDNCQVGIDASSHQGTINWSMVKAAGVDFAIIQVGYRGYTGGGLYRDPYFVENMEGAKAAGLQVGAYFFSQAITQEEAVEEAQFVLNCLEGYALDLPLFFDWEYIAAEARTDHILGYSVGDFAASFCDEIEKNGYTPGVYFNKSLGYRILPRVWQYELWYAEYNAPSPSFFYQFKTWQYTQTGTVPGITGNVDLNIRFL